MDDILCAADACGLVCSLNCATNTRGTQSQLGFVIKGSCYGTVTSVRTEQLVLESC